MSKKTTKSKTSVERIAVLEEKPIKKESTEKKKEEIKVESTEKPVTNLPLIPLTVFCTLSGKKPDQIAGFRRYAINQNLKPMTVPQWREELVKFANRPVR